MVDGRRTKHRTVTLHNPIYTGSLSLTLTKCCSLKITINVAVLDAVSFLDYEFLLDYVRTMTPALKTELLIKYFVMFGNKCLYICKGVDLKRSPQCVGAGPGWIFQKPLLNKLAVHFNRGGQTNMHIHSLVT